jgi:hypothetical protein
MRGGGAIQARAADEPPGGRLNKRALGTMFVPEPGPELSLQLILAQHQ